MGVCRDVFVLIQQKLTIEENLPRSNISIFGHRGKKRIFSLDVVLNTHFLHPMNHWCAYM